MTSPRLTALTILAFTLAAACASIACAHSGRSGTRIEQETTITIREDAIELTYSTQLNRPGAYLEFIRMDRDGDGRASQEELDFYFAEQAKRLFGGLELTIGGKDVPLKQVGQVELSAPPPTKLYRFEVPHPEGWENGAVVEFHNENFLDFPGSITIDLDPGEAADIVYDSRWTEDSRSKAVAQIDPQERDVVFRYHRGTGIYEPGEASQAGPIHLADDPGVGGVIRVARPPRGRLVPLAVLTGLVFLCVAIAVVAWHRKVDTEGLAAGMALLFVLTLCVAAWTSGELLRPDSERRTELSKVEARQIFQNLHRNIYKAFDARTESEIYDTLADGLEGEVLDDVYNEVYEALRMRDLGATRFSVRRVRPISTEILTAEDENSPAFRVRYRWRVYGTVTHFGHTHARFNEYEALYRVRHDGRSWHISGSRAQQNKRVTMGQS